MCWPWTIGQTHSAIYIYIPYITVPNSTGLPPVNSHIYLEWNEEESDEPNGWYLCKIMVYFGEGRCRVEYPKNIEEVIALADATWKLAKGNSRKYRKPEDTPPDVMLPHIRKKMKEPIPLATTPHRTKAFADDLTLISKDIREHQHILTQLDKSCADLDLHLKAQKCISYVFDGKDVQRDKVFQLAAGKTTNLSTKPTKFLGKIIGHSVMTTSKGASQKLHNLLVPRLDLLNAANVRGEYKVWCLQHYLLPSIKFHLATNVISKSQITNTQKTITRYLRSWLNLPQCITPAALFHPHSLNISHLSNFRDKAQSSFLLSIVHSQDPLVRNLHPLLEDDHFQKTLQLSEGNLTAIEEAASSLRSENSTSKLQRKKMKDECKAILANRQRQIWDNHLNQLTVQNRLLETTALEEANPVWKRLMYGMPSNQLSFVLCAATECLPSPVTLARMKIHVDRKCALCGNPQSTAKHILSCCPSALARYAWRHDKALLSIIQFLKQHNQDHDIYADLDGHRASESPQSTLPPSIMHTLSRPDICIVHNKSITFIELTIPWNSEDNLNAAHRFKESKSNYISLICDLHQLGYGATLQPIEVGCLGHYRPDLPSILAKTARTSKTVAREILDQISSDVIMSSKRIFDARHCDLWS